MRVLYVEDDIRDGDLARRTLSRHAPDITVDVANNLREARVRLASDVDYDAVLCDLHLPDGIGLDLLAEIRKNALPIAVIILTGLGDEQTAVAALKAGADDYLAKRDDYLMRLPVILESALARFHAESVRKARRLRVLYIEHSAIDVDLTRRHLDRYAPHIRLDVAHSVQEALQRLPSTAQEPLPYDIILVDYQLPGLNALDMLKILTIERHLDVPVVLVTGQGNEDVVVQTMRLGAADYLVKHPDYLLELPTILENAYYRAQLAREQSALRESEEQYRLLFESTGALVSVYDRDGVCILMNNGIATLFGGEPDNFIGKTLIELHPETGTEYVKRVRAVIDSQSVHHYEDRVVFPTDSRWLLSTVHPVQNAAGVVYAAQIISQDITELKQAEAQLKASLREKDSLIRELFHRTKNNMQVIIAMLSLQTGFVKNQEAQRVFQEMELRIQSMALVHEKLYRSQQLSAIQLDEYVCDLARRLMSSYQIGSGHITLDCDTEPLSTLIDIAIPCGLILNELMTNALKHAFPRGRSGTVHISLRKGLTGEILLEVVDDGVGVPADFDFRHSGTFGLQMVYLLAEYQLQGRVTFETDTGVRCQVAMRDNLYSERV